MEAKPIGLAEGGRGSVFRDLSSLGSRNAQVVSKRVGHACIHICPHLHVPLADVLASNILKVVDKCIDQVLLFKGRKAVPEQARLGEIVFK